MKLIDQLVGWAGQDDQMMGKLAADESAREQKQQAYGRLGDLFDQMASDGYLSKDEIQQLMAAFKAQGLDTSQLDALYHELKNQDRVAVTGDVRTGIEDELSDAKQKCTDPDFNFKAQWLVNDYNQNFDTATSVQKDENDMYMTAIRNLVA
jgi:hypothetical protein